MDQYTIFRGMNIHLITSYFDVHQGDRVLTHPHILFAQRKHPLARAQLSKPKTSQCPKHRIPQGIPSDPIGPARFLAALSQAVAVGQGCEVGIWICGPGVIRTAVP